MKSAGWAAVLTAACLAGLAVPQSASASTVISCTPGSGCLKAETINSSGADGNAARFAPYVEMQATGDCVVQSALVEMSGLAGKWVASHAGIDKEAVKLGVLAANDDGGSFDAGNVALFEHYGFKATAPKATNRKTVMKDLAAGDSIQVAAYAGYLWQGVPVPGHPDWMWVDNSPVSPDHAVTVDAVNKTTYAVTISDTGVGMTYTIPWTQFARAWAPSGYLAIVVSK